MVSKYDVFYVIATKGELRVTDIVDALHKNNKEYNNIFNKVLTLEKEKLIVRNETILPATDQRSIRLYHLLRFCTDNGMNYNLMLKSTMTEFIEQASRKEFFTTKDITINPRTFSFYRKALSKYGMLFEISRKPLKCKLLRHDFLVNLLGYFGKKAEFYIPEKHSFIKEIRKELKKYRQNLSINYSILDDLEKRQKADFIYSSLNLEGNPLTLPETQKLILEEVVPAKHKLRHIQEVTNYEKAVGLMIEDTKRGVYLDLPLILKYHGTAMNHQLNQWVSSSVPADRTAPLHLQEASFLQTMQESASPSPPPPNGGGPQRGFLRMDHIHGGGQLRRQNVRIKGNPHFKTCEWRLIPIKLKELVEKYREFVEAKKDLAQVISFAAFYHNEFQRIHPFIDGNSRIARLLMFRILRAGGIPVLDLPTGYFDLYMDITKRSKRRDDEELRQMVEEMVFFSLRRMVDG